MYLHLVPQKLGSATELKSELTIMVCDDNLHSKNQILRPHNILDHLEGAICNPNYGYNKRETLMSYQLHSANIGNHPLNKYM